ncbi:hypothetical protein [Flectobacillus major]|uniref:hypothetical protein n=1 Tax=Flectobacillus major TaxID=103 RepID=UPI00047CD578|nr:hypothetical protein [Flectobacillus major]
MNKAYIKYLIPLCILLLGFSGQLTANMQKERVFYTPIKSLHEIKLVGNNFHQVPTASLSRVVSSESKEKLFYFDEEQEEDEKESFTLYKKSLANSNVSSAIFYSWYAIVSLFNTSPVLHFGKHFSQYPLNKLFIVFRVFRI